MSAPGQQTQSTQTLDLAVPGSAPISRAGSRVSSGTYQPVADGAASGGQTRKRKSRSEEEDVSKAFKHAALSLTTLYKASQRCRREGWLDCLDELYDRFIAPAVVTSHYASSDDGDHAHAHAAGAVERIDVEHLDLGRLIAWVRENRRSAFADAVDNDGDDSHEEHDEPDSDHTTTTTTTASQRQAGHGKDADMTDSRHLPGLHQTGGTKRKSSHGR